MILTVRMRLSGRRSCFGVFVGLLFAGGCATTPAPPPQAGGTAALPPAPSFHVSPADETKRTVAQDGMVSSANPLASEAGVAMLRAGGNAIDAAVATAFALGVVEPQMSGLGGSGAATVWLAGESRPVYLDFYAAQPADAWRGSSALKAGPPGGERDLRGVGIPGEVAGLLALHETHGALTREQVLAPAIRLADEGYPVGRILADFIAAGATKMKPSPEAMQLYFPDGKPLTPGAILKNPELAESLRRISRDGARGFYEGPTAEAIVSTLNAGAHPATLRDFAAYSPQSKEPLCTEYRGHTVLSAPPPQTGMRVLHTLELLEGFDLRTVGLPTRSAAAFDILTSALRVGQAGATGNGDPNWMVVPARGISSDAFAATRRSLVGTGTVAPEIPRGDAGSFETGALPASCRELLTPSSSAPRELPMTTEADDETSADTSGETTHLSVVDSAGNAVALTVTNSSVWGSGAFAAGFFLNDSGFRFTEKNIELPSRSRWRIRTTTIAPTIVLKDGAVQMVIGAPGAGRIPTEIVQVMVYTLDYGLDPLDAVRMPRIFATSGNPQVQVEHGFTPELLRDVRAMGYDPVTESSGYARLYMVVRQGDRWIGVADTRHDGQPRGYDAPGRNRN
jgi:gamma-glutamyltranspeptidase/glutathione hydrolase